MRRAALVVTLVAVVAAGTESARGSHPLIEHHTSWSPDGRSIAYLPLEHGRWLTVLAADGSAERFFYGESPSWARWSPDGRRLAYTNSSVGAMMVADVRAGLVRVLESTGNSPFTFDWAPGGSRLVFRSHGGLSTSEWDGTGRSDLVREAGFCAWHVVWSARDDVAWEDCRTGQIKRVRADGTGMTVLATGRTPRWSPSGGFLAYQSSCGNRHCVRLVGADGSGDREVARALLGEEWYLTSWSATGRWIAAYASTGSAHSVLLLEVDGAGRVRFVRPHRFEARWSPTADAVTFTRDGNVLVGSIDGSERRVARGHGPDWAPDGRRISFLRAPYDEPQPFTHCLERVFTIDLASGREQPVSVCRMNGGHGRDTITGTSGPEHISALGGRDLVFGGGGPDGLDGGSGDDRLFAGAGSDRVFGGRGADRIGARDAYRDHVRCGLGVDVVLADRRDRVAVDCEIVRRR